MPKYQNYYIVIMAIAICALFGVMLTRSLKRENNTYDIQVEYIDKSIDIRKIEHCGDVNGIRLESGDLKAKRKSGKLICQEYTALSYVRSFKVLGQ